MAKKFYSVTEAAERLGKPEDEVKALAANGDLQVFRDRNQVMFKREQVDALADDQTSNTDSGLGVQASGDTNALDLTGSTGLDASGTNLGGSNIDAGQSTGASVFDADEIDPTDSAAKTQASDDDDEDGLVLESVGSGSGLLDLNDEGDGTGLGDDIFADSSTGTQVGSMAGESGIQIPTDDDDTETMIDTTPVAAFVGETVDTSANGLAVGLLLGTMACLITALISAIYGVAGVQSHVTTTLAESTSSVMMWSGILLGVCIVCGVVGLVIGKMQNR
ncbi:MAG: hypothetical protein CMJ20_11255 [Phycisphaeraceae bacterium]|nr:hypothetical protein [Phycisphaeraceae bacterium]|tara:strand:+ start:1581 stop:2411 length:831 start_codon:yes stop_codon:yes gene_type:complete